MSIRPDDIERVDELGASADATQQRGHDSRAQPFAARGDVIGRARRELAKDREAVGKWVELCHRCVDLIEQGALLWRLAEQLRDYLAVAFAKGCGRLTEHAVVAASGAAGTVEERVGDASEGGDDD